MVNVTERSNSPRASASWIAFTGFALAAAAQAAAPAEDMTGVKVTYRDLNLASKSKSSWRALRKIVIPGSGVCEPTAMPGAIHA